MGQTQITTKLTNKNQTNKQKHVSIPKVCNLKLIKIKIFKLSSYTTRRIWMDYAIWTI